MNRLVDPFGRAHTYLRISVTDRCNLRCTYCMPEDISWRPRNELLSFEEIVRVSRIAVGMGIEKVRITGGEPLMRTDCETLLAEIKAIPGLRTLALTSNAVLLKQKLPRLLGVVDAYNISLDTFRRERFLALTRRDSLQQTMEGIEALLDAGEENVKLNAVILKGVNDDEILDFVAYTRFRNIGVRFIEFMPFADNAWDAGRCMTMQEMLEVIETEYTLTRIPDGISPISRDYSIVSKSDGVEHCGTVGVIASMSVPFCDSCSRLRLTAEGMVMPCLHSPIEFDLRTVLRNGGSDRDIEDLFMQAIGAKPKEHPGADELLTQTNRVMIQIGG